MSATSPKLRLLSISSSPVRLFFMSLFLFLLSGGVCDGLGLGGHEQSPRQHAALPLQGRGVGGVFGLGYGAGGGGGSGGGGGRCGGFRGEGYRG